MATPATVAGLNQRLKEVWGFDELREHQGAPIMAALQGRDSLVVVPTGGGKSLCYQLPAAMGKRVLVISPLIALMKDQVDGMSEVDVPTYKIDSKMEPAAKAAALDAWLTAESGIILYVAPERLDNAPFRTALLARCPDLVAVDEAHCISMWGHDFRPSYRTIGTLLTELGEFCGNRIPRMGLTATATPVTQDDIMEQLAMRDPLHHVGQFNRPNLYMEVDNLGYNANEGIKLVRLRPILERHRGETAIVYAHRRDDTEAIATYIEGMGFGPVWPYHAGMRGDDRKAHQEAWMEGQGIMVATTAFGMGIDKPDVRLVVHWAYAQNMSEHYQQIGRAGRDGQESHCVVLYTPADQSFHTHNIEKASVARWEMDRALEVIKGHRYKITRLDLERACGFNSYTKRGGDVMHHLIRAGVLRRPRKPTARTGWIWAFEPLLDSVEQEDEAIHRHVQGVAELTRHRYAELASIEAYATARTCRRELVRHFGDNSSPTFTTRECCDNCARVAVAA